MPHAHHLFVCQATRADGRPACGDRWEADRARATLKEECARRGLPVRVSAAGCLGPCAAGPNVMLYPERLWWKSASEQDLGVIAERVQQLCREQNAPVAGGAGQ